MATVTLAYQVSGGERVRAAVAAADVVNADELSLLGMSLTGDATVVAGDTVTRTIVLTTTADGDARWPTSADLVAATRGLYLQALAAKIPAVVTQSDPVVS